MMRLKNKNITLYSLLCLIIVCITGCGFQLRNSSLLAPELQTIEYSAVDKYGELARIIKQHLLINNVTIVESATEPVTQMRILQDKLNRRTLSVFPNGQVAEYELIYTVRYQILQPEKDVENFEFELNRDYQDDPDVALAKSRELALMLREMRHEAARKILHDMASL